MRRKITLAVLFLLLIPLGTTNMVFGFDRDDVNIHGFVSQGYLKSSDNNYLGKSKDGSFQFNELGINFTAMLTDELRFGAQIFSRDLGDYGNNEVIIDWASLDYTYKDWLGFRAGKMKTPFGLYNRKRDTDMLRTSILMPQSVYSEGVRDFALAVSGASLYGNVNLNMFGVIDYELYVGTIDVPQGTPYIKDSLLLIEHTNPDFYEYLTEVLGADPYTMEVEMDHMEGGALVWNTPLSGLRFSVTDMLGEGNYGTGSATNELSMKEFSVFSVEYEFGNFTFAAERMKMAVDLEIAGMTTSQEMEGYYGAANWDIAGWVTVGASYGEFYPDAEDKDGDDIQNIPDYWAWQKDTTLSVRFNINEYWCVKFETHFMDGVAQLSPESNIPPEDAEQNWILYAVKTSLNF